MVEGAKRQKTPNEIALTILLVALTIVFLVVTVTLLPFSLFSVEAAGAGTPVTLTVLVALLVCLIPTTIGGLLSAIGVAGMSRMMQANVIATSGRAVEAAGDVDVLLLDKTGTITLGNRQASAFLPAPGVQPSSAGRRRAAGVAGRRDAGGPQHRRAGQAAVQPARARRCRVATPTFVPFTAQTRMSGVDLGDAAVRSCARARSTPMREHRRGAGRRVARPRCSAPPTTSRGAAARRWWWPTTAACSASSS